MPQAPYDNPDMSQLKLFREDESTADKSSVFEKWMPPDNRTETTIGNKWKAQGNNYQNENKHYEVLSGWLNRPSIPTACNASQIRGIFRVPKAA